MLVCDIFTILAAEVEVWVSGAFIIRYFFVLCSSSFPIIVMWYRSFKITCTDGVPWKICFNEDHVLTGISIPNDVIKNSHIVTKTNQFLSLDFAVLWTVIDIGSGSGIDRLKFGRGREQGKARWNKMLPQSNDERLFWVVKQMKNEREYSYFLIWLMVSQGLNLGNDFCNLWLRQKRLSQRFG